MRSTPLGIALCCLLAAAGPARADDFPSFGLGEGRTRSSDERSGARFAAGAWQHKLPATRADAVYQTILASPAAGDGFVVFGNYAGLVRAVRESDGAKVWEFGQTSNLYSSPAFWRGRVHLVDVDDNLFALRLTDGAVAWKTKLGGTVWGSPAVAENSLLVTTGHPVPRVLRIDADSGKVLWQSQEGFLQQAALASPAVSGQQVVVGEMGGRYHSFALGDGRWQWTAETDGEVNFSSPLILGDRVYLFPGGSSARLHAVALKSGTAVPGWPLALPVPDEGPPAQGGRSLGRRHAVSSPVGVGERVVLTFRVDEDFDGDGDRQVDHVVSREYVVAVDTAAARVAWVLPSGRLETSDPDSVPTHTLCPTPALHRSIGGANLVTVASSLSPSLRVLSLADGHELWTTTLSARTRSSPLMANGRLAVATDAGVLHSFLSSTNQPPVAPWLGLSPADGREIDVNSASLRWGAGVDIEGETLRYEVRVDDDGELLRDWDLAVTTLPGQQTLALDGRLQAGRLYTYAIRARDAQGAYSAWSRTESFRTVGSPAVLVEDQPAAGLEQALATARPGSTIRLGAGRFVLSATVNLPAGVSLAGAGPHLTVLDARGLAVGVAPAAGSVLGDLTVAGAQVGVAVEAVQEVRLHHIILRDNSEAGLHVGGRAGAELVSATVVRNGVGVRAHGPTAIANALITINQVGIEAADPERVQGRHNNVAQNRGEDYRNARPAPTDLALPVAFEDDPRLGTELRLQAGQPTTDRGDPADAYDNEPQPNGGRINIGAFGNTRFAELSLAAAAPPAGADPGGEAEVPASAGDRATGGVRCTLAGGDGQGPDGALVIVVAWFVRLWRSRRAG